MFDFFIFVYFYPYLKKVWINSIQNEGINIFTC